MDNLIEIRNLKKYYKIGSNIIKAIDDISLDIEEGNFLAITGPSGSGKSTLMHILGCLDTPTSGSYKLDGQSISEKSGKDLVNIRRFKVGFVFQTFNLLPRLTVFKNVELPLIYQGIKPKQRKEKVVQALKWVNLQERSGHKSNELSGGEQQRVAIARAIVTDPKIILADEPTGNLDTKTGQEIMNLLVKLHQNNSTVIVVTHDSEIAGYAQKTISLRDGKIV